MQTGSARTVSLDQKLLEEEEEEKEEVPLPELELDDAEDEEKVSSNRNAPVLEVGSTESVTAAVSVE